MGDPGDAANPSPVEGETGLSVDSVGIRLVGQAGIPVPGEPALTAHPTAAGAQVDLSLLFVERSLRLLAYCSALTPSRRC